jgi:hypothetical protein
LQKTSVTGNGQKITYPQTDRAEVTAMFVELAPGAETGWHKHPIPVYAYVISGNLSVELEDGKCLSFAAGDAVIEVVNTLLTVKTEELSRLNCSVLPWSQRTPIVIKRDLRKKTDRNRTGRL